MNAPTSPAGGLNQRQRDYLHLTAWVLAQQGRYERADRLLAGLCAAGGGTLHVLLCRAVLRFHLGDYRGAMDFLEQIDAGDPIERFGRRELSERHKLRRYLKARCYRELGNIAKANEAVDIYLRRLGKAKDGSGEP